MGLFSGLKRLGRGIGKRVKKAGKWFDDFDDLIRLKEIAQIAQFIPGVNVFAKPISMAYSAYDIGKGVKEGDLMGAGMAGLQMYGSSKIDTGGLAGLKDKTFGLDKWGAKSLGAGVSEAMPDAISSAAGQVGGQSLRQAIQSNIGGNLKNYAGGFSAPFKAYAGLDPGSQLAVNTLAPPLMYELSGRGDRRAEQLRQAPSYDYQPMDSGQVQGFSPTTQLPTQAQGGITGDDYGPGSLYELDEMMDAKDDENRRYWHKKDLEEGMPSQFDPPPGESPWPAPGKSTRPLGPFRDYAGELGLTPWMFDTLLDARIGRENRLRGPSQREMEEIEAEQHGWLPGLTPEEKMQSYQEAVERSNRYEPRDYWHDPTLPKTLPLARGGITGDDWHRPINRLPANYEGWVTQPSLATLGEAGKEAVLPLNKLLPAMNKGGLNYSPGQAIVGEAGPEYVTRLGPGEEQYAQSILREQPVPQMREGGVAGGVARGLKRAAFPRTRPGWQQGRVGAKVLGKAGKWIPGLGFLFGAGQAVADTYDLYQGTQSGKEYGLGDYSQDMLSNLLYSVPFVGPPVGAAYDYKRGELDELIELLSEIYDGDEALASEPSASPYAAQAYSNGQRVNLPPGTSENQMVQGMMTGQLDDRRVTQPPAQAGPQAPAQPDDPMGPLRRMTTEEKIWTGDIDPRFLDEETPSFLGERTPEGDPRGYADPLWETDVSFQGASPKERIDLSLLDNENARYWMYGEGSRRSPNRLYQMIRDLGYGDTREQVEDIRRNAKLRGQPKGEKWYRGGVSEPRPKPIPYPGLPPG